MLWTIVFAVTLRLIARSHTSMGDLTKEWALLSEHLLFHYWIAFTVSEAYLRVSSVLRNYTSATERCAEIVC